jgi:hypothetical protein
MDGEKMINYDNQNRNSRAGRSIGGEIGDQQWGE